MASEFNDVLEIADLIAADPKLQMEFWSDAVRTDARDKNPLKDFVGGEGSGMPILEKKEDITGGQVMHFSTMGSVLGQGVRGNAELKSKVGKVEYNSFSLTVDFRRWAIAEEQLVKYFSQPGAKQGDRDALMLKLASQWWARTKSDDEQITLRNKALFATNQPNVLRIGNGATRDAITLVDTIDTNIIDDTVNLLVGLGATPMSMDKDLSGSDVPQYLLYGTRDFLNPLKDEQRYREGVLAASQGKGSDAMPFSGKYPQWDNNLIFKHNLVDETGPVRKGSPLQTWAQLGVAIASGAATVVTGGGARNTGDTLTDTILFDFFAYFPGYAWKTFSTETLPTDNNTYYAIIYNVSGADKGKYEIVSYVAAGNTGNKLTVIRELDEVGFTQKTQLTAAGRYSNVHPSGSLVIPCNRIGVPIGYALHMGAEALCVGIGALEGDPIEMGDDFKSKSTGKWHQQAAGVQSIIGYAPTEDTDGRYPNYALVEGALSLPRLNLETITPA